MAETKITYWQGIAETIHSLWNGFRLSMRHLRHARHTRGVKGIADADYFDDQKGIATIQYPYEMLPVPDNGRYRLHNEIDDCIVCDKCAKVCPVDCITIEPIKSPEEFGKTSDGTSKRIYAATFDIDMGKCCFCGLCTTVCPTECLTMTKVYDFSVFDIREHNYVFAEMTEAEIEEKKKNWEAHQKNKLAATPVATPVTTDPNVPTDETTAPKAAGPKPVFRPKIKPPGPPPATT